MQQTAHRTGRPGRPRSPQVIARDETIYKLIADGIGSRSALAQATGLDRPTVAESTKRLKKAARIRTCSDGVGMVWVVDDGTPCP